jgi:SAM-dependent methyltransferase
MRLSVRAPKAIGARRTWPSDRKILLHVGCGRKGSAPVADELQTPEWHEVRFDIDPEVEPDIIGTIVDMSGVDSMSVDAIWCAHNLEHIFAHEVPQTLREFYRVLRPGGVAHIQVPDISVPARAIAKGRLESVLYESPAGPVTARDMIFGFGPAIERGEHFMAHRTGFTRDSLAKKLSAAGFSDVRVVARPDLALWATAGRGGG